MHYWSVEGAEDILGRRVRVDRLDSRTMEQGHTKTFACWVWTSDVASIPTKHTLAVLPRGAGRVEEMEGFYPPDRRVAPPPATADYTMLVHVHRIEDWTTPSPRSSRSGQSGLPSSDSDNNSRPFPAVTAASWTMGAEDGQRGARMQHRVHAPVASIGCSAAPTAEPLPVVALEEGHARNQAARPEETCGGRREGKDPVDDFFRETRRTAVASLVADPAAAEVHAAIEAAVAAPLDFGGDSFFDDDVDEAEGVQLDAFSPMLFAATTDCGQFNRATPTAARTMEVQLGVVTSCVCQLEISADDGNLQQPADFSAQQSRLSSPLPARRPSAPPKRRAGATPTRHNARLAANPSSIPVAQRASFRIVKELGLLGPREKLTEDVAKALIRRFEEPLSDSDIAVIAKLTHLDSGALRVMARMAGPDGHAAEADV
ncbi:D-3-phosphoglycerate dehydrogenase, chloroplastic [Hordeum vulgare]|nr:D-3-phosphoglycerate dehydrogenase, chloroplastic [Hordeum vulgare]